MTIFNHLGPAQTDESASDVGPLTSDVVRICLWSGPRNVSTAVMYAFAQRSDTRVVDEPLYAHYLRVSGRVHPGREEVLAAQNADGDAVVRGIILGPVDRPVLFVKQMAHHLVDLNLDFLEAVQNVFLIRDPREMLPSLVHQIPDPDLRDTGLALQTELYQKLEKLGQRPAVVDAKDLLLDPRGVLEGLCASLALPFEPQMLRWEAGGRIEDGVWAPYWYHNIHKSTGFAPYRPKTEPFPGELASLLDECVPYYEFLMARRHAVL